MAIEFFAQHPGGHVVLSAIEPFKFPGGEWHLRLPAEPETPAYARVNGCTADDLVLLGLWAIPMWFLIDTGNIYLYFVALLVMTVGLGLSYGPQAALYAEMFPADIRYSGVSIGYAIGAILGGAFAPMIAELVFGKTGQSWTVGLYIVVVCIISLVAVSLVKTKNDVPLNTTTIDLHG